MSEGGTLTFSNRLSNFWERLGSLPEIPGVKEGK